MTQRIEFLKKFIRSGEHHNFRKDIDFPGAERFAGVPHMERVTQALCDVLAAETPVVLPEEKILFFRTVQKLPEILTEAEWEALRSKHFLHEQGRVCNITPDYGKIIASGFDVQAELIRKQLSSCSDDEQKMFYNCALRSINAVLELTERYRLEAERVGNFEAAEILAKVPRLGATSFREALQTLRIIHYALWCEGEYHNTLGRFDQYMYPYYKADIDSGRLTEEEAFELLEDFFLSLNRDSDLYPGIQQGDNGQSMMLGGVDRQGKPAYNELSVMCLRASRELKLIDPKLNLRVNRDTPLSVYEEGTLLTREGLGFPQYSNDDVVIEGLTRLGYDLEDARDYTVAACWEFIIPGLGMDIPNVAAVNFPSLVNECIVNDLKDCDHFEKFFNAFARRVSDKCAELNDSVHNLYILPAPLMSVYMDGCIENGRDISFGNKYNNLGFHGVGISTAADSLYAVKKQIFEDKALSVEQAISIIENGYAGKDDVLALLRNRTAHMGNDIDDVDEMAVRLMDAFSASVSVLVNERGGCVRAGTGSAMYYLWSAAEIGATLSGHRIGDAFSANYSPELFVRNSGPLSVIRSFTKPDLMKVINGGPLTLEFHASIFKDEDSIRKVALLVQAFIALGGHQLQLNSLDPAVLRAAQEKPEEYRNLIVRIWGWSAYFVELDKEFQEHVISRHSYMV